MTNCARLVSTATCCASCAFSDSRGRMMAALRVAVVSLLLGILSVAEAAETQLVPSFSPNPGNLTMYKYVPDGLAENSPLVVALHGCSQSAQGYDDETGWTELADEFLFAVLLPEQKQANHPFSCFNFFESENNQRDKGEAASIAAMVEKMKVDHRIDADRVYVSGLSGGGAMTAVMLATYPDLFRGGGIIAGTPYECASTRCTDHPLLCMQRSWMFWLEPVWPLYLCGVDTTGWWYHEPFDRNADEWGDLVRDASDVAPSTWPVLSLWHGTGDRKVHPSNLNELVEQWTNVHGTDTVPDVEDEVFGYPHRVYHDAEGQPVVETFLITDMPHAAPVDPGETSEMCGLDAPPYFLDVGICASYHIAKFWGLTTQ